MALLSKVSFEEKINKVNEKINELRKTWERACYSYESSQSNFIEYLADCIDKPSLYSNDLEEAYRKIMDSKSEQAEMIFNALLDARKEKAALYKESIKNK